MNERKRYYLDTSVLVKRFVEESGSREVDRIFRDAYRGDANLVLSSWNLGEAAVVFDKYERRGLLNARDTMRLMFRELKQLVSYGSTLIVPVYQRIIMRSIKLILTHHIYLADAIQICTCKEAQCNLLVTADEDLTDTATKEGLGVRKTV